MLKKMDTRVVYLEGVIMDLLPINREHSLHFFECCSGQVLKSMAHYYVSFAEF